MADVRIKFEDPPERRGGGVWSPKGTHAAIAAKLRKTPAVWAHIQTLNSAALAGSQAHAVRTAALTAYAPAGSFESKARTVDDEHRVYVRFVGEGFGE